MAAQISVRSENETRFEVTVRENGSETRHVVTVEPAYAGQLAGKLASTEELVRRSFEFLIEREPKESILSQFNLREISRYFPDYETEIRDQLAR
ncbi:MAG TPA: hypothetical protein VNJ12_05355 [Candidatus Dormibacteraeota bacterium]|nr:hypothetical protein [Candidatus Dormibacteraeota bacterium]